ncbi:MAG: hypothetical protein GWN84_11495 [Gammaproteobacteria bacterium]|nr:hypothetical protein [Gammaproteobacteria bacterium]NIR83490.1 hypothetical protein [Gammaproteobacteria bacterium]NIR91412.1 hypothetical protein [Gammaproteobacteria bacterium]NIU04652.1 hypothetical protein [Gammaproteobacteria bacterium]NIV51694.1 hypothetical protein [Gammaproteobacteria bacterium]
MTSPSNDETRPIPAGRQLEALQGRTPLEAGWMTWPSREGPLGQALGR